MFPYKQISKLNLEKVISSNKRKHLFLKNALTYKKGIKITFGKTLTFKKSTNKNQPR